MLQPHERVRNGCIVVKALLGVHEEKYRMCETDKEPWDEAMAQIQISGMVSDSAADSALMHTEEGLLL